MLPMWYNSFVNPARSFVPTHLCVPARSLQIHGIPVHPILRSTSFKKAELVHLTSLLSNSCALFCIYKNRNSFLFKRFRTLCPKPRGWVCVPPYAISSERKNRAGEPRPYRDRGWRGEIAASKDVRVRI